LGILGSQVVGTGRPEDNVVEPTGLSVGRASKVQWKKEKPNPEELAVERLTQQQIAVRFKVRRSTVAAAVKKFENYFKNRNTQVG
jgi:hypothetical protein